MKTADIITVHPGKQHNFEQAEQLTKYFNSLKHITSIAFSKKTINKFDFFPAKILNELEKRSLSTKAASHVDIYPWLELSYKWKRLTKQTLSNDFFRTRNRLFQRHVLKNYSPPRVFIGFDTSSEYIFKNWKGKSILILDLTIAAPQYKKKLALDSQLSKATLQNLTEGDEVWYDTYQREIELADYVLCGSDFVKQSCLYLGAHEQKLRVLPYGANLAKFNPLTAPSKRIHEPFRIAFIGNVGYRKGADVLFKAWENFGKKNNRAELHFYGNVQNSISTSNLKNVFFHGFVSQEEMIMGLNNTHVSILPTFFEGSSYAIYQSMALGLAVVTTPNCGSIVKHMHDGILIEYGSEKQIYDALSLLIEDRNLCTKLSETAMTNIKQYTWDSYGVKLNKFISSL